jgi:hypothetical protein
VVTAYAILVPHPPAWADAATPKTPPDVAPKQKEEKEGPESPWLLVPTLSSNPKLGTSVGGMAGYMYYFDPESKVSIFGTNLQYTSTNSIVAGLFAKTSFGADHHRLLAAVAGGNSRIL